MARVIPVGAAVNEAERQAIAFLRDHLPASYLLLHNFDVVRDGETFEVDIAVVAPHAVYLVDVKGTRGLIDVYGPKWYPEGRQPFNLKFRRRKDGTSVCRVTCGGLESTLLGTGRVAGERASVAPSVR